MRIVSILVILLVLAGCSSNGGTGDSGNTNSNEATAAAELASPSPLASPAVTPLPSPEGSAAAASRIEDQYKGFVHKDSFALKNDNYEIYYWNSGEFNYTQFVVAKNGEILFDSKKKGLVFEGGYSFDEAKKVWAEALLQNDRPTLLFSLADNRPESACIVLEEISGVLQVTVHDNVLLKYEDADQDGKPELLASPYSGQMPLGPALFAVYELKDNQYVPDTARTLQYYKDQLPLKEQNYKSAPTENNFEALIDVYLLLDRLDEAQAKFPEFYKWAGQTAGDGGFVDTYSQLIQNGSYEPVNGWMDKLKPLEHGLTHMPK
ncbi:hypothetical protein [Paenibacillus riograndensis]|uniref:Putative secreted protein n=1 Tax=Paenibacillus riograndensis SBR5 TaxID=1073571 RepID=A0A0E4HB37_9BACL|nr:hypothetical protein [Paenibacillus riograndensis]CQR55452.1 putative secreted protein [Paenibacillus riograndensis SBR5]